MKMNKKYELTNETIEVDGRVLHRIRVLKDFANVKAGDLGGFLEAEGNLSQVGNCWVHGNARVYDNAEVHGDAKVFENAEVRDNAVVRDNARVYGNAEVHGDAWVFENAMVCESAEVYGNTEVSGNAIVYGNAKVNKTPIFIQGFKHNITITETHIFIGCEGHTIKHWKKEIWNIGKKYNYTDDEIRKVIAALKALTKG